MGEFSAMLEGHRPLPPEPTEDRIKRDQKRRRGLAKREFLSDAEIAAESLRIEAEISAMIEERGLSPRPS